MPPNDAEEIAEISRALLRDLGHVQDIHAAKVLKGILERQIGFFKRLSALEAALLKGSTEAGGAVVSHD